MNSSGSVRRAPPIERFLGTTEASGGPFALLGVAPQACTEDAVLTGLDRQLERVAHHIECDTPEADEVRLALHAAAAQLLDPAVRRHLVARWLGRTPPVRPAPGPTGALLRRTPAELLLEHDAVLTLGMFGGWNRRSLQRLVALAHARGLASDQVARTLRHLATRRRPRAGSVTVGRGRKPEAPAGTPRAARPAQPAPPSADRPLPEQIDPAQVLLRNALIIGGSGVLGIALLIALVVALVTSGREPRRPPPPPAPVTTPGATPVEPARAAPAARATATVASESAEAISAALRDLAGCPAALAVDPAAAASRFERAVAVLASSWCGVPRDRLVATHDAIVEVVYRVEAEPAFSGRVLSAIASGAESLATGGASPLADDAARVWPAAWSVGMLARLSREKDVSAATREMIEGRLGAALGHGRPLIERSFESGATLALRGMPGLMLAGAGTPSLDAWRRWAAACEAVAGASTIARDALLLEGLDALLVLGPEAGADRAVPQVIADLTTRVSWRQGDLARERLLRWFDDRRVTASDLQAVTSALATRSAAEGVDLSMVLSSGASDRVRTEFRERYARVWGIAEAIDRGALAMEWRTAAQRAVERSRAAATDIEHLAAAAVLARLHEAAWRIWKGDSREAARLIGDHAADIDAILQPGPARGDALNAGDAGWAERYLAARRSVPLRLEQLTRLASRGGSIGPVDAEVLVAEALAGSPAEVRTRAAEVARQFAATPALVNALLEALPRAPRVVQTSALVSFVGQRSLPALRDPAWPLEARRALVERLLELTAAAGDYAAIDQLSAALAVSYRGLASESPLTAAEQREAPPPAHLSASLVRSRLRSLAAGAPHGSMSAGADLADLDRRHHGRAGLARGPVQAFAAEQVGAAELLLVAVGAERPGEAARVGEVGAALEAERRRARHILEQLNAAERSIVLLWLIRIPEGTP